MAGFGCSANSIWLYWIFLVPQFYEVSISQAVSAGASADMVTGFIRIGLYIGFITGPLFSGLIGAGISAVSGLVTKKIMKKKK